MDVGRRCLIDELVSLPEVREALDHPETTRIIQEVAVRGGFLAKEETWNRNRDLPT